MIDAYCSQAHYWVHIAPIWEALPPKHKGTLYVGGHLLGTERVMVAGAKPKDMTLLRHGLRVLVASHLDYQTVAPWRKVILAQHGSGQSYGGDPDPGVSRAPSYAGGDNQDRADLFLVPGPHPAQRSRARYPHVPVAEIGCPALDRWLETDQGGRAPEELGAVADRVLAGAAPPQSDAQHINGVQPIVALAWHWENQLCPETRTAYPYFRSALAELGSRYTVIGHAHPRQARFVGPAYETLGIPWADYETVMSLADVLVADNSSVGWEFLATGRPVVWLTPPWYRNVDHGIRFGPDFASRAFLEAQEPWQLIPAIEDALRGYGVVDVSHIYSHLDGRSAQRAAAAIVALDDPKEAESMMTLAGVNP